MWAGIPVMFVPSTRAGGLPPARVAGGSAASALRPLNGMCCRGGRPMKNGLRGSPAVSGSGMPFCSRGGAMAAAAAEAVVLVSEVILDM